LFTRVDFRLQHKLDPLSSLPSLQKIAAQAKRSALTTTCGQRERRCAADKIAANCPQVAKCTNLAPRQESHGATGERRVAAKPRSALAASAAPRSTPNPAPQSRPKCRGAA